MDVVVRRCEEWDPIVRVNRDGWRIFNADDQLVTRAMFSTRKAAIEWAEKMGHEVAR